MPSHLKEKNNKNKSGNNNFSICSICKTKTSHVSIELEGFIGPFIAMLDSLMAKVNVMFVKTEKYQCFVCNFIRLWRFD